MTAIVMLEHEGIVWVGGDSYRTIDGFSYPGPPKVWKKIDAMGNTWVFGVSGSADLQRIAQYRIALPKTIKEGIDLDTLEGKCAHVNDEGITNLFEAVKAGDELTRNGDGSANMGATIMLGFRGTIFRVTGFAAVAIMLKHMTTGKGADAALSRLHSLEEFRPDMLPEEKIRSAIAAAGKVYPSIGGETTVVSTA